MGWCGRRSRDRVSPGDDVSTGYGVEAGAHIQNAVEGEDAAAATVKKDPKSHPRWRLKTRIKVVMASNAIKNVVLQKQLMFNGKLNPNHKIMKSWELYLCLLYVWVAVVTPILIFFQVELCPPDDVLWWVELLVDVSFLFDIVLKFNTRLRNPNGTLNTNFRRSTKWDYIGCSCCCWAVDWCWPSLYIKGDEDEDIKGDEDEDDDDEQFLLKEIDTRGLPTAKSSEEQQKQLTKWLLETYKSTKMLSKRSVEDLRRDKAFKRGGDSGLINSQRQFLIDSDLIKDDYPAWPKGKQPEDWESETWLKDWRQEARAETTTRSEMEDKLRTLLSSLKARHEWRHLKANSAELPRNQTKPCCGTGRRCGRERDYHGVDVLEAELLRAGFFGGTRKLEKDEKKGIEGRLRFEKRTKPAAALAAKEILHRHRSLLAFWKYLDKNGKDDDRGAPYRGGVIREVVSEDPDFTKHRMLRDNLAKNELLHDLGLDDPRHAQFEKFDQQLRMLRKIPLPGWGRDIEPAPMMS
eukprot:COSAG01_NODE_1636_length_9660_cov_10.575881_2_plen_520_part_00